MELVTRHTLDMLSAYHFRAHLYTIVLHQVQEDFSWMADHGTDAVVIGVLEQDLFAARENLDILCAEARRAGLDVLITPSRWGSLVAGCPKVPSILCATEHDCWAQNADGSPHMSFLGLWPACTMIKRSMPFKPCSLTSSQIGPLPASSGMKSNHCTSSITPKLHERKWEIHGLRISLLTKTPKLISLAP